MAETEIKTETVTKETKKTDPQIWNEIIKLQLDGVMHHNALMEGCLKEGLLGFAEMHRHHSIEEFRSYLHVTKDYIQLYNQSPDVSSVKSSVFTVDGRNLQEKMECCLDVYENWEKSVLVHLRELQNELKENKDEVNYLIEDVKQELYCIRRMYDDLYNDKCEKLDKWLQDKFGEC